jgi:hypothetical protein
VRPWPGIDLWGGEIGLAHALPEVAKALEPRPFVFEAALNEVEGVGAAEIREIADGTLAHTISPGSQDDALHVGAKICAFQIPTTRDVLVEWPALRAPCDDPLHGQPQFLCLLVSSWSSLGLAWGGGMGCTGQ